MIRHEEGCTVITLTSRIIVDFFREMGIKSWKPKVPHWIFEKEEYIAACIRGLIDTEGSIGFKIYKGEMKISVYRQLAFTSRNNILLTFVRDGLSTLGLNCTQTLIKNIYLSNDKEIDKYRSLVGFHNPKLEKRSLIRSHLEYQNWRGVRGV